jgi:hypothetical protein
LVLLPEWLSATADYVAKRRIDASARVERHRPAGAAARRERLALVLLHVAKKRSAWASANRPNMGDWLHDAMTWCEGKPLKLARGSRRFKELLKDAIERAERAGR